MLSRRKLALLATASVITGLIAGPAIAGGGDNAPDTAPAPAEPAPVPESEPSAPETPESDADRDVSEICVGGDFGILDGDHPEFPDFDPLDAPGLTAEQREKLKALEDELRSTLEKIERASPLGTLGFEAPDLDALAESLREQGLSVEKKSDGDLTCLEVNGDHEAFEAAMEEAFGDHFGENDSFALDVFPGDLPTELVEKVNAEMKALAEHFDELGIEYEIAEEGDLRLVEWDESDPAANAAAEEFLKDQIFDIPFFFEDEHFCEDEDGDSETGDDA